MIKQILKDKMIVGFIAGVITITTVKIIEKKIDNIKKDEIDDSKTYGLKLVINAMAGIAAGAIMLGVENIIDNSTEDKLEEDNNKLQRNKIK